MLRQPAALLVPYAAHTSDMSAIRKGGRLPPLRVHRSVLPVRYILGGSRTAPTLALTGQRNFYGAHPPYELCSLIMLLSVIMS